MSKTPEALSDTDSVQAQMDKIFEKWRSAETVLRGLKNTRVKDITPLQMAIILEDIIFPQRMIWASASRVASREIIEELNREGLCVVGKVKDQTRSTQKCTAGGCREGIPVEAYKLLATDKERPFSFKIIGRYDDDVVITSPGDTIELEVYSWQLHYLTKHQDVSPPEYMGGYSTGLIPIENIGNFLLRSAQQIG